MLRIRNLHKSYGAEVLFDDASLQMTPGERLGLVGRNGHGKSTLFQMILGNEHPDDGAIELPRNYRIGHLAQHLHFTKPTVLEEGCLGLSEDEEHDHYKVERILFGLGFTKEDMAKDPTCLSGGFQIRLNLTKVLVANPNLLLLDEPTNYLDIVSVRWITGFLRGWKNELIIISHDREFMDSVTTHTAAIHRQKIRRIPGGTAKIYEQLAQEEELHERMRINDAKQRKHIETFVNRFRAQASKAAAVQSRVRMLEKMPAREKLAEIADLEFAFHSAPFEAKTVMDVAGLAFGYDPAHPLIRDLHLTIQAKDRIAVIGKNGKGKSTLLNLLAGELAPMQGVITAHAKMQQGYFGQTNIDRLDPDLTVEEEIANANPQGTRTSTRSLCGIMMFSGDKAEKRVAVLSGGEKSRVLLGKILAAPANLLLLDEPTNHLDMQSIESLVESLAAFEGAVVIVTHSEMILRAVATKLVVFQHGETAVYNCGYDEFLEKVGWDEEERTPKPMQPIAAKAPIAAEPQKNKKEARKERSQLLAERAKCLAPLKKEMDRLEQAICALEAEAAAVNAQLIVASTTQNIDDFVRLSKTIKTNQAAIDEQFARLETVTRQHDAIVRKYAEENDGVGLS